ncbi:MAG TPA: methyltransferase domain-containing protein [Terriglobia bacterium]|nr:methyltransferase domain-containing protein [Terriglobia bacterium]
MMAGLEPERTTARSLPVMEAHALWAKTYDDGSNPLLALEERAMEPLLPELKNKYVLDVACGTGRWLTRLRHRGVNHVVGVDLSPEMLQVASAKPALAPGLVRADCLALPLRSSCAHLTICSFAISYLDALPPFASELARVSRPHARVLLSDFHPEGHRRGWKRTFRWEGRAIEIASFAYSMDTICEAFQKAGFDLKQKLEPHIDEPERHIFAQGGKLSNFESIRGLPAIFILDFQLAGGYGNVREIR